MKNNDNNKKRVLYEYLVILMFVGACIALVGYQYHKNFEKHFRTNIANQLKSIADLKVGELEHWVEERRGDAEAVFGNKVFAKHVKSYLNSPKDSNAEREIKIWMEEFQTGFNYDAVFLTDTKLNRRISISKETELPNSNISNNDLDSLKSGKLVFTDLYQGKFKQKTFLKVLIPILDLQRLIGIIELRIDPQTYLFKILNQWPISSETSEILLLRREGNEAVYLNDLRFQKNTTLNLRVPIEDTSVPAVRAILGYQGYLEGKDYRGKAVVSYVAKVPNSPWFLVVKSDESEVYAPLRNDLWQTLIFGFVMFVLAGFGLGFLWRNQRALFYKERIKAAEALRESEERFRILFDKAPLSYQSLDVNGNFIDVNQTWLETLGYKRDDVIGKWFGDFLVKEDTDAFRERFLVFKTTGKSHSEFEMIHRDGTNRYISFEGRVAKDTDGNFIQTHGILQDITELKKSELERQVIYEITQGVMTTDNLNELLNLIHQSLSKVLYADNYFVALFNQDTRLFSFPYYVDQIDSTPKPDEMSKSCTAYVFRTGKPIRLTPNIFQQLKEQNEVELVGSPSPSWLGIPLKTPSKTIGVLVLQHYEKENVYSESDVQFLDSVGSQIAMAVERKQAEENLRNERSLFRTVIDNIPDSIYSKDIAFRKTLANHTELYYSGATSEIEILGKTDFDFYPKKIAEGYFTDDKLVIQKGQPVINREESVIDSRGQKHWLLTSKLPLKDEFGNIIGLVGIGRDITERKLAEEEIKLKNEELLKTNAEKDKFFSIIAHDLRSPFNSFLGLTHIMAEELPSLTMAEVQDLAITMKNSATNLYGLLENLLKWAQIQQGVIPFTPKVIQLKPTVDECFATAHETARNKGIDITCAIPENTVVYADSNMLQAVIRNLLSNAIKFTPGGGKVSLTAIASNNNVEISISDTGIGMSQTMIDNLFRIEVQTGRKGTEGELSTGLGLLLCNEFIEKHGGKLWVKSEEGNGSVFRFTVPGNEEMPKKYRIGSEIE